MGGDGLFGPMIEMQAIPVKKINGRAIDNIRICLSRSGIFLKLQVRSILFKNETGIPPGFAGN